MGFKDYNYKAVNLQNDVLEIVDKIVKENPFYRSRADYVRIAIYEKIKNDNLTNR